MYQNYREKLDVNHFWELEGQTAQKHWKLNYSTNFLITSTKDTNWLGQGRFIINFSLPKSRRNNNRSKIKNKQINKADIALLPVRTAKS